MTEQELKQERKSLFLELDTLRVQLKATQDELDKYKQTVDCNNCANRGGIYGLSQESNCSHCKHQWKSRKDLFVMKEVKQIVGESL